MNARTKLNTSYFFGGLLFCVPCRLDYRLSPGVCAYGGGSCGGIVLLR